MKQVGALSKVRHSDFSKRDVALARWMNALSHPARLSILATLAQRGECVCGEIVSVVPLAQSTVSQHLKQLREAGLIQGEIDGATSCYCVDDAALQKCKAQLLAFFEQLEGCCKKGGGKRSC